MLIYLLGLLATIVLINLTKKRNNCSKKREYRIIDIIITTLPFTLICGLRYGVGTDYFFTYVKGFNSVLSGNMYFSEFGFNYFIKMTQLFTNQPYLMFFLLSFIFFLCINITILNFSENKTLSLLYLFFSTIFFWSMNNVRQAVAMSILFASFPFFKDKNDIKFLFFVFLASLFHYSSIIFIIPYIWYRIPFFEKHQRLIFFIVIVCLPFIAEILIRVLSHTKYYYFITTEFNNGNKNLWNILFNTYIFIIFNFYLLKRKKNSTDSSLNIVLSSSCLISYGSVFITSSEMMSRINFIFSVFYILLIPRIISLEKNKACKKVLIVAIFAPMVLYFYYTIIIKGYHGVLPYHSILELLL